MKCECPTCGKITDVSAEELSLRNGTVVCPQCLAIYHPAGVSVAVGDVANVSRRNASPDDDRPHHAYTYCHYCGKQIPKGINFCPFCGVSLKVVYTEPSDSTPAPVSADNVRQQPRATAPQAAVSRPADNHDNDQRIDWKPFLPSLQFAAARGQQQRQRDLPSRRYRAMAYAVIAALLVVLVVIAYKAFYLIRAIDHYS